MWVFAILGAAWLVGAEMGEVPTGTTLVYVENEFIRVGVDLQRGGALGYLADRQNGKNVVNVHDLGRWIGQSYYSGPRPFGEAHPAWRGWPWNPVSAGDVYGHPSQRLEHRIDKQGLYIKSIPKQWALNNVAAECHFETWLTLDQRQVHVRNRLTNRRADRTVYPAMDQELPFVYTIGELHRVVSYTGDKPFSNEPLVTIPRQVPESGRPRWTPFYATEHWAALVDEHDWGLGVIHPDVVRFLGGFYGRPGAGGPRDDATGYLAPVRQEILDYNIVYEFHYTLVLDHLSAIRRAAYEQRPASQLPNYHFVRDRQHWWFHQARDTGLPIEGQLHLLVEGTDPQMIGPEGFWQAADVPTLTIRAAHHTRGKQAELFWETMTEPGFSPARRVSFPIIPDGQMHTYTIRLANEPGYRGAIRRLRLDPIASGSPGDLITITSISP